MVGKYRICIKTNKFMYDFELKRKYTVILGDSATGKSVLYKYVRDSGTVMQSGVELRALSINMEDAISTLEMSGKIVIIDESCKILHRNGGEKFLEKSDNYFIIAYRGNLSKNIPFSIDEVYEINSTRTKRVLRNELKAYYKKYTTNFSYKDLDLMLTEDSKSSYTFFKNVLPFSVRRADGNGDVENKLNESLSEGGYNNIGVFVDGAAFGAYIRNILTIAEHETRNIYIYAPESFEYLILKSGIVKIDIDLDEAYLYCDDEVFSKVFGVPVENIEKSLISWERFYHEYLRYVTKDDTVAKYDKDKLPKFYIRNSYPILKLLDNI